MALKFDCPDCGREIQVKYLKQGEQAKCPYCGNTNVIPDSAREATLQEAAEFASKMSGEEQGLTGVPGDPFFEAPTGAGTHTFLRVCAWICIVGGILFGIIMTIAGIGLYAEEDTAGSGLIMIGIFIILESIIFGALLLVVSSMADNLMMIRLRINELYRIARKSEQNS